jgi:heptosyltransferase-3
LNKPDLPVAKDLGRKPERKGLLVFRIGQIGDTVAAIPSLWVLRRQFQKARIVVLSEIPAKKTHQPPEAVLPSTGLIDGFEKYPGGASLKNFFRACGQIRKLQKNGFDTLVYLAPSGRTRKQRLRDMLFFRLCGFRKFLATKGFAESLQPRLSNGTLGPLAKEADALLHRLELDGLQVPPPSQGCMDLKITESERETVKAWWQRNRHIARPHSLVVICVGGKAPSQLWPLGHYSEVVKQLINQHELFPVIVGGKEDREIGKKLLAIWGGGLCAAGELTVRESAALMETAQFYLGNNTGAMHMAAATGIRCVAVSSARDWPGIWEPYGHGHKVLRHDVPCAGCLLIECNQQLECLTNISVQQVYRACLEVMATE